MSDTTLDGDTEAAIGWLVVLNSGAVTAADRAGFDAWLAARPGHRAAWERLTGQLDEALRPARAAAERAPGTATSLGEALARTEASMRQRRRLLRGALGLGGMAIGAALLLAERHAPLAQLAADLRTGTGERRDFKLPDGSSVTLDARSAADLDFSPGRRIVTLRQGALIAEAAPAGGRDGAPFIVRTAHGQVRALGTRFTVRRHAADSYVGLLAHRVEVTAANGQRLDLAEGQGARFGPGGATPDTRTPQIASAWQRGLLEAHDQPLGDVIDTLRAYRPGFIRISPRAATLRVYGSYALDDTDRALAVLAETLPISLRVYQRGWLVVIETA